MTTLVEPLDLSKILSLLDNWGLPKGIIFLYAIRGKQMILIFIIIKMVQKK